MKLQFKKRDIPEHLQKYFKPVQCEKGCYICHLTDIFREVKRVLKPAGTVFVNLGDSYASSNPCNRVNVVGNGSPDRSTIRESRLSGILREKSLMNIPARFAIAMTDELQFIQRNNIIWHKPACMPSSAKDRFTVDFEPIFFFSKNPKYKFNQQLEPYTKPLDRWGGDSVTEDENKKWAEGTGQNIARVARNMRPNLNGRNARTVWSVNYEPQTSDHYASYPSKLIEPMVLAGTDEGDIILDPFSGTGTTGVEALRHGRKYIGIELVPKYVELSRKRIYADAPLFRSNED